MTTASIVQRVWNYCHTLRDDGVSYLVVASVPAQTRNLIIQNCSNIGKWFQPKRFRHKYWRIEVDRPDDQLLRN